MFLKYTGRTIDKPKQSCYISQCRCQPVIVVVVSYDGKGEVPNQIHSYLSTNFKELRNLPKDDEGLRTKGKDRWYVPDPNKAGDLEKLREEFEDYRTSSQKRLKVFASRRSGPDSRRHGRSATTPPSSPWPARFPRTSSKKTRSFSCGTTKRSPARGRMHDGKETHL